MPKPRTTPEEEDDDDDDESFSVSCSCSSPCCSAAAAALLLLLLLSRCAQSQGHVAGGGVHQAQGTVVVGLGEAVEVGEPDFWRGVEVRRSKVEVG